MTQRDQSSSSSCHGIGTRGPCTNDPQFELDTDRELYEMTDDQLAYVERTAALLLGERGLVHDTDPASGAEIWRLGRWVENFDDREIEVLLLVLDSAQAARRASGHLEMLDRLQDTRGALPPVRPPR